MRVIKLFAELSNRFVGIVNRQTALMNLGLKMNPLHEYHFVRRYLERQPPLPLTLQQVDPLIRELEQYRPHHSAKNKGVLKYESD